MKGYKTCKICKGWRDNRQPLLAFQPKQISNRHAKVRA